MEGVKTLKEFFIIFFNHFSENYMVERVSNLFFKVSAMFFCILSQAQTNIYQKGCGKYYAGDYEPVRSIHSVKGQFY
jgi:hypothetical protein